MNHKKFFNEIAHKWDEIAFHSPEKLESFLEMIDLDENDIILDAGCGTGALIPWYLKHIGKKGNITGVDISEEMLKIAEKKHDHDNVNFICKDIINIERKDHYDAVICYSVYPHFEDGKKTISHLSATLKKNGKLVICHSQSREEINNLHREAGDTVKEDNLPTAETLAEFMGSAGLKITHCIDNDEYYFVMGVKS